MRVTRVITTLAAALVASAGLVFVQATPAAAATICSAYTNGEVWQTSTRWGRVRERVCLEYTSTQVRGRVYMQVDYPQSCSLTVGLPPSGGISCPGSTQTKAANLDLHGNKISVGIKRGSATKYYTCTWGSWSAGGHVTMTRSCYTPYLSDAYSSYRVYARDVMGDVKSDGDGWKVLAPVSWTFRSP